MFSTFADLERARLPAAALGRLAALRGEHGVEVALHDRELWVRWNAGNDNVTRSLLPLSGCRLYGQHEGRWYAWGETLPAFDVPSALRFRPIYQVLFPAPVQPIPPHDFSPTPDTMSLVADPVFRPTQALECSLESFLDWADTIPACVLSRYQGVIQKGRILVLGSKLPWLEQAERFWGRSVLVPIGYRSQPFLTESDLRRAVGIGQTDLLVLRPERCEIVAADLFAFLTHAALRLACAEGIS